MKPDTTPTQTPAIPDAFLALFRQLVVAFHPRMVEREAPRVYFEVLQRFPLAVLAEAVQDLVREKTFFPTTGEWFQAALMRGISTASRWATACAHCAGRGLVCVRYRDESPFDIAICDCVHGQTFRTSGEAFVRAWLSLPDAHRIAWLEDFEEAS